MPARSHDARHRVDHDAAPKPRRLIAGLALPTAAAVALMFTAAGAAMATSPKTQSVISAENAAAVTAPQPAPVDPSVIRARRAKALAHTVAVARADAQAKAARSAAAAARVARDKERKLVAARVHKAEKAHALQVKQARAQEAQEAARAAQAHDWQLPISNPVKTSGFGYRWGRLHAGEDYGVSIGTNLASMSAGTVAFAGQESGYGTIVKIRYWDGTVSYYGHMSSISVSSGESVAPGQIVGQSGNTGHSTGPHLHLEIHPDGGEPVDPLPWLADHNVAT